MNRALKILAAGWAVAVALAPAPGVARDMGQALGDREWVNVLTFTRLLGYAHYFYPGDTAAATDWDRFAIDGMKAVQTARDADELAQRLTVHFAPVAPSIVVFRTGIRPPAVSVPAKTEGLRVVAWKHVGIQASDPAKIYKSSREFKTQAEAAADAGFPDPRQPFVAQLGGGLSCSVPLALFVDDAGTLPRAAAPAVPAPVPAAQGYSAKDRSTRLASVAIAWNIIQHSYPYFDVMRIDWADALSAAMHKAATDTDELQFRDTLRLMIAALRDGHGYVAFGPERPGAALPLRWDWIEDGLIVTEISADSAGAIAPGDAVLTIDGRPVAQVLREQESRISGATPQWIRFNAVNEMISCADNSRVVLEIEPFARRGTRQRLTVPCEPPQETAFARGRTTRHIETRRLEPFAEMEPGIFYLDLDRIDSARIKALMPRLEQAQGIILDLRGYPMKVMPESIFPHLSSVPMASAQWHMPNLNGPDRVGMTFTRTGEWSIEPRAPLLRARRAFITDGRAISYAESFMGIVEHYRLAEIVGGPTAGTNGNINALKIPGGYTVVWTGMKVLKQDGSQHHGVGIQPTIAAARTRAGVAAGRDELLERAVQAVKGEVTGSRNADR